MKTRISRIVLSLYLKTRMAPNKLDIAYSNDIRWFGQNTSWDDASIEQVILLKLRQSAQ